MKCPNCGANIAEDATECGSCFAKIKSTISYQKSDSGYKSTYSQESSEDTQKNPYLDKDKKITIRVSQPDKHLASTKSQSLSSKTGDTNHYTTNANYQQHRKQQFKTTSKFKYTTLKQREPTIKSSKIIFLYIFIVILILIITAIGISMII
jgi:ABC-type antimicrobial peptide transport system permease subunit